MHRLETGKFLISFTNILKLANKKPPKVQVYYCMKVIIYLQKPKKD